MQLRSLLRALLVALAWHWSSAQAQYSRHEWDVEFRRLDIHPSGSLRREIGTQVYGILDLAVAFGRKRAALSTDCSLQDRSSAAVACEDSRWANLESLRGSRIGIRSHALLDRGLAAHVEIEHGLDTEAGVPRVGCRVPVYWDRKEVVGLSYRPWGRLDIGRQDRPARAVVLFADPWGGSAIASPGSGDVFSPPSSGLPCLDRADNALRYSSSEHLKPWRFELQATTWQSVSPPELGLAVWAADGPWQVAVGWHRWDRANKVLPLGVVHTLPSWRAYIGLVLGERSGRSFSNAFVGAAIPERAGPRPGEYRFGVNLYRSAGTSAWKASAGFVQPLSRHTSLHFEVAAELRTGEGARGRAGIGVLKAFSL